MAEEKKSVEERLKLERIIKNDISNPRLKEGLLKRYLDYDEIAKDLPSNIKNELLVYTNKEVINDIDIFKNELNITDLSPGQKESIETIFFDYVEPTPIEDAFLAEMEGWDIDAQGNPINPNKKPEDMSKFQKELINEYNYIVENGQTSAKLSRSYLIDLLMNRPDGQSVEEFIKANNFTQEEIDIIKYETRLDTPTNVVDEGVELYHSISKGETVNKNFHAGTYNAALDRASQFYGGEQLYKIANDNLDFIQEQANDLVSELSDKVSFENVDDMFQITDDSVTREVSITLPTGNEARFNIVAETFDNTLTVKFQDVDGYDGGQIYSEELLDIDYEPDDLKTFVGDIDIVDDETVASNLLDEIGLKSQAGEFNYKDGYDLYKVNIKPGANVVNIPDTAIFIENGIEKEMSSDFIQGFIERPKEVNRFTDVTQIIIDNKTYDITDTFTSSQALQEHFKDADVLVYTNDIEDVGSKSYMFLNENSYVLEKIDDAQFNIDVANKYIKNNPYETISKLARREAFTEPERYQVLLNALLDETDTPTNVVDYQDTGIGGRPFEIKDGVPVDEKGNRIKSIGAADETVTIYRVVPEGVDSVNANDWVFINKGQAEEALKNANANTDGNFKLIEIEVSRGDVYPSTRGNLEMGYFPTDTPATTGPALLETNIKFENVMVEDDTPRGYSYVQMNPQWQYDVVKPNKIFNPDKFETRFKRPDQTFKSGQEIVDAILSGTATDEDITRFFIFAASKSNGQAWGYGKKWSSADAIADIVKIGIFSDRDLKRVIPVDDSGLYNLMKERIRISSGLDIPDKIFLDMANEQGQFTNVRERMRNVILDAHNKIYAENPNDYFILWRGGNLNRFNTWQSFSKRQEAARGVMIQLKFSGVEQGGGMGTYVINKNNMIDLDALGLSHGREQEVIVLAEAANKPGAKLANNITTPENLKTYTDNWALRATEPELFPKQGFVIQNISQQLNQLGQPTQNFFTEVIQGMDKHAPLKAYEPIIQFENAQLDAAQDIYNKFVIQGGDFNQHIFTSIPTFYETQIVKAVALNNMLQNFEKQKKVTVLDIGATEGTWSKLLGSLNENLQIDVLEPNPAAEDIFNQTDQVENVRFQKNAFSYLPEDQGKFFLEEGGRRNIKFINFGAGEDVQFKYDVVHESMTFQFLDNNRKAQIDFIAKNVLNDNGFLILEEKYSSDDVVYQANEELKNDFKKQYYSEAQINTKQHEVITSMGKNQVAVRDMENILKGKFKYVQQYWDAGNFKGYIASNNPLAETFVEEIYKTDVSLTGHEFSTNPTEQEIKFSVQKQMDNKFINKELAKELTKQTLESSKEFINKSSDAVQTIFKNVKSVGGVGLALGLKGLSKVAPVLEPGDVLIEKGIEKFTPQLNKAAQKLGFASLPVQNILPVYVALELNIAAAELVQAAMYAYEASQEKAPGKPISNLQESLTRFLLPKSVEDEAIDRLRYKENVMRDFYNTPTGKAVLEEVDFGSQLLNQLGEERVARYSPGWNLSKAIFGLFGTIGTAISGEQANISEQTRDNMGQALLTGIGK